MEGFSLDERMERNMINQQSKELLKGLRVLELGTLIAGPFAGRMFADFGADVIIENFRPGKLEEWGIGYEDLKAINPKLIMIRISGYGQDGPYSNKPGFGSVGEAIGGIRHITGYPDRPPVRAGISLGDALAS